MKQPTWTLAMWIYGIITGSHGAGWHFDASVWYRRAVGQ